MTQFLEGPAAPSLSRFDKEIRFLLCVIAIFCKYAWKIITFTNALEKILDKSNREPRKIWVDNGSEFYNRSMKPWLQDNDIELYSTDN